MFHRKLTRLSPDPPKNLNVKKLPKIFILLKKIAILKKMKIFGNFFFFFKVKFLTIF